jgi:hypothetical protein
MTLLIRDFTKLVFTGPRYDNHVLPFNNARDLFAYENLLIKLAQKLYFNDNPIRKRVPKGFSDVQLAFQQIEEGSASPTLSLVAKTTLFSSSLLPFEESGGVYYKKAHDIIVECISSPDQYVLDTIPQGLWPNFSQLGVSLKDDESMEFIKIDNSKKASLTQKRRKELAWATKQYYEREVDLYGLITQAYGGGKAIFFTKARRWY